MSWRRAVQSSCGKTSSARLSEQGFTLVELSVALVLTLLVVSLGYSTYRFAVRLTTRWQKQVRLASDLHSITQELTRNLRSAARVVPVEGEQEWQIERWEEAPVVYGWKEHTLSRNGQRMHDGSVNVTTFGLRPTRSLPLSRSTDFRSGRGGEGGRRLFRLTVEVATVFDTLRTEEVISRRESPSWKLEH